MKTNKLKNILLSGLLMTIALSSCTSDFKDINTNKRVLSKLDPSMVANVFGQAEFNGWLYGGYSWQIAENLFSDLYVQYYSNWQTKFQTDRHNLNMDWSDAAWNTFYQDCAKNLAVVLQATKEYGMAKQHAIAQVYKVLVYQRQTDYWGPIPYSQVNNNLNSVPYDKQEDIYKDFFVQLDSATTTLAQYPGENAFGASDQIYNGDVDKWLKLANTVRLRVAMRISYIDPVTAKTQAEKAVAAGVLEVPADNALLHVTSASPNPLPIMLPWNEFRMSATMESILKGFNDPRLSIYWAPAVNTGLFTGMRNGLSIPELSQANRHYDNLSTMAPRWSNTVNQSSTPWEVMQASEAWFLRAEGALNGWNMGVTAEQAYYNGIDAALKYWGVSDENIAVYKAGTTTPVALPDFTTPAQSDITVAWSADASKHLEQIMTQKWIGLFPDGWEAWAETRRTEYPKLYPVIHSDNTDVPADQYMRRLGFQTTEFNNNNEAVTAAKAYLSGPDNAATRLWWNTATKK